MSDNPQGPDWWQASDGAWYPPELHPSRQGDASVAAGLPVGATLSLDVPVAKVPPIPVPELPKRPTWSTESDPRPDAGPMYPDLFQQAVAGSSLANVVTVNYADGEARPSLDVPTSTGHGSEQFLEDEDLVTASARMPAEVGAFSGASAKRRWRTPPLTAFRPSSGPTATGPSASRPPTSAGASD